MLISAMTKNKGTKSWGIKNYSHRTNKATPKSEFKVAETEKEDTENTNKGHKLERLQADDFVLSIVQAEIDKEDYSEQHYRNEAFLAFYKRECTDYFAYVWQKIGTQSYGKVTLLKDNETERERELTFLWKYVNSHDDRTGTAQILLRLINRPVIVAFQLSILTESGSLSMYKGYVNGSLNWKPYF